MKFRTFAVLLTVMFVLSAALTGCASGAPASTAPASGTPAGQQSTPEPTAAAPAEKARITYLYSTSGDQAKKDVLDKVLSLAEDAIKDEVIVEATDTGNTDMNTYLKMKAAAGDLQDVLAGDATESGLGMSGYIMELPRELQDMSMIPEQGKAKDGRMYNLPASLMPWEIVYNKELFAQAGITSVPKTWSELLADCETLKKAGIPPFLFMLQGDEAYATGFLLLQFFSADVLSKNPNWTVDRYNGAVKFDCPEWRGIFDKFKLLIDKGYVEPNAASYTSASGQEAFAQGKAAMIGMPQATIATLQQSASYHFGGFPLPSDTDNNMVTISPDKGLCLRAGMDDKTLAAAVKFVKAYFSPEPYKLLLDYSVSPSVIKGFTYTPKAPNDVVAGMIEDMSGYLSLPATKTAQIFGGVGGYTWYDAWNDSYRIIAEIYAGKAWTNDDIVKKLDEDYQKGYDAEKAAAQTAAPK
jgi:ABC-type glycerol-3-phosphate transport system substrate-binding protein